MSELMQLIVLLLIILAVFVFCAAVDWWFVRRPVKRQAEQDEAKEDLRPIYGPEQPPLYFLGYLGKNTRMLFSSGSRKYPNNYIPVWGTEPLEGD